MDLVVGDVHATVEELTECRRLIDGLDGIEGISRIIFLGDTYNTHSVIRVEVMAFWRDAYQRLSRYRKVIVLKGNHDESGDGLSHALLAHPEVTVVDHPTLIDGVLFVPYMRDPKEFVEVCRGQRFSEEFGFAKVLVCHQSFLGARYENGHRVEDGVNQGEIPQNQVISGHIHTPQQVGKVWYPGAPRWRSLDDAGVDRAVWRVDLTSENVTLLTSYPTDRWCRKIVRLEDREDRPARVPEDGEGWRPDVRVDVYGTEAYLERRIPELKAQGARTRGFRTDLVAAPKARESEGMTTAFGRFLEGWKAPRGTPAEALRDLARRRVPGVAA